MAWVAGSWSDAERPTDAREWAPAQRLVGRDRQRRLLDALLGAVSERGAALALWGAPGVGKTALLDYAAAVAAVRVLRVQGVESEAVLPFAALADLLLPLEGHFRDLPGVQRDALRVCLALSGESVANPYVACVAALNVLAAAGEADPRVVLVDDLHWVDPSSRRVLLFVARRLSAERVGMVFTVREENLDLVSSSGVPSVEVGGLPGSECVELVRGRGLDVAPAVLDALVGMSGGNPLALLAASSLLSAAQLRGQVPITQPLFPGGQLQRVWAARTGGLPGATREALAVLAASRCGDVDVLQAALGVNGLTLAELGPAEEAGLVAAGMDRVEFRHPVLRTLVLQQTPLAGRLIAFRALAEVSTGVLRAWYLAASSTGVNEPAAQALVEAAGEARGRSAYEESALAWHRAAQLTPVGPVRAERLRVAAADAFVSGASLDAAGWCEQALHSARDPLVRADIDLLRGRILTWLGQPAQAHHVLIDAATAVRDTDAMRASVLYAEAVLPAVMNGRLDAALQTARNGAELAALSGLTVWQGRAMLGEALALTGRIAEARPELLAAAAAASHDRQPAHEQHLLTNIGYAQGLCDDPDSARQLLTAVIEQARQHSTPAALPAALSNRCELDTWAGRWASAYADATEALQWAQELRHTTTIGHTLACLARLDALRGDRAGCEERITRARRELGPLHIHSLEMFYTTALGADALAHGDYDTAAAYLDATFDHARSVGLDNPLVVPFAADLIEAHIRTGEHRRAGEALAWLHDRADDTGLAWPAAAAARCRGLLADSPEEAEACFQAAEKAHQRRDTPFERARTLLCRGEVRRRFRRPAAARAPLTTALAAFQALGAAPWARRAAAELAATGQRPTRPARPGGLDQLTPQELQVARAVTAGLNNIEAAAALFVSRKTIEAHLTRVYRKLGVRSRTDLARTLTAEGLTD
jgi:DNA-binding NarL/FixJ family response regulator/MoxR-like ATPase